MMNRIHITSLCFLMMSGALSAQGFEDAYEPQTLFGSRSGFGGYLGINNKVGEVAGQDAYFVGGEVAIVLNHAFNLGFEGYGMVNQMESENLNEFGSPYNLQMGYGGLHLEPVLWSENALHITAPVLLGAGGIGETRNPLWREDGDGVYVEFPEEFNRSS